MRDEDRASAALRRVGNYELFEEIGRGGMGVVYRARQIGLNRVVAVKMILAGEHASPGELTRFRKEAEAAARLQHPGIVQIHEVGVHDGLPYFSMEFVEGGNLQMHLTGFVDGEAMKLSSRDHRADSPTPANEPRERRRNRPVKFPAEAAAKLIESLARAVHYAHQQGVIHRDLKPANILLQQDRTEGNKGNKEGEQKSGSRENKNNSHSESSSLNPASFSSFPSVQSLLPKITDFGLAKCLTDGESDRTRSGAMLGTPSYMAPEQASGKSGRTGPATDVYALGAILYELLTGQPAFHGTSWIETLEHVRSREPVRPSRLVPSLPRDLQTICLKCLEKDPARRYASAELLAEDLCRYRDGEPILAEVVSSTERIVKWAKRRPAIASLVATVAAVTLIGFVGVFWQWRNAEFRRTIAEDERTEAQRARNVSENARNTAELARAAAERSLYFHRIAQAQGEWQNFQVGRAEQLLDECPQALRDWEWSYLKTLCHAELRTLNGHTDYVSCVAYSPDGKLVASGSGRWASGRSGEVIIWDAATGETRAVLRGQSGQISSVAFSPDSQRIASCSVRWDNPEPSTIKVWSVAGEELVTLPGGANDVAFSPDGRHLASGGSDGFVRLWSADDGTLQLQIDGHSKSTNKNVFDVAFSPDGKRLASVGRDGFCRMYSAETGGEILTLAGYDDLRHLSFSPDGRYLAFSNFGDMLLTCELAKLPAEPVLHRFYNGRISAFAYSPEGRRMALSGTDGTVRIIDVAAGKTSAAELKRLPAHNGFAVALAFSPDGRVLASGGIDRTVKLSDAQSDYQPDEIAYGPGPVGGFYRMAFAPHGGKLFLPSGYNTGSPGFGERVLHGWDFEKSARTPPMRGHDGWLTDVSVNHDGTRVATASEDKTARIWDTATGAELRRLVGHSAAVTGISFSSDGGSVATASDDGSVRIWNSESGDPQRELPGNDGRVTAVRYSPDDRWLASAGADGTVRLWSADAGDECRLFRGHSGKINSLAFSHDGKLLASAGADETVQLWNVTTGDLVHVLRGHNSAVNSVCFGANDRRLASSSTDCTVKLWDVESGEEALTLRSKDATYGLAFSPNGKRLVTARGANLLFWDSEPQPPSPRLASAFDVANRAWHVREVKKCEDARLWQAAIFHRDRLIELQPDLADHYARRGAARAELHEWNKATADYEQAVERGVNGPNHLHATAMLYLNAGRLDDYRQICRRTMDLINPNANPFNINTRAWTCSLAKGAVPDPSQLIPALEQAIGRVDSANRNLLLNTLGLALYRAGRFDDAVAAINQSMQAHGRGGAVEDWLILAMTHHRLGHSSESREWLDKSIAWLENHGDESSTEENAEPSWTNRIERRLFRAEAELLIRAGKSAERDDGPVPASAGDARDPGFRRAGGREPPDWWIA